MGCSSKKSGAENPPTSVMVRLRIYAPTAFVSATVGCRTILEAGPCVPLAMDAAITPTSEGLGIMGASEGALGGDDIVAKPN